MLRENSSFQIKFIDCKIVLTELIICKNISSDGDGSLESKYEKFCFHFLQLFAERLTKNGWAKKIIDH